MLEKYIWGKALAKLPKLLQHIYAFLIVVFGFVIFAITDWNALGVYICLLFSFVTNSLVDTRFLWYLGNYGFVIAIACILACPVYPRLCQKAAALSKPMRCLVSAVSGVAVLLLFVLSTAYMVSDTYNPFLYFRF